MITPSPLQEQAAKLAIQEGAIVWRRDCTAMDEGQFVVCPGKFTCSCRGSGASKGRCIHALAVRAAYNALCKAKAKARSGDLEAWARSLLQCLTEGTQSEFMADSLLILWRAVQLINEWPCVPFTRNNEVAQ